jgi:hypothetical protein
MGQLPDWRDACSPRSEDFDHRQRRTEASRISDASFRNWSWLEVIAEPIQKMNRLAQISILQALASSPDALLVNRRSNLTLYRRPILTPL